MSACADGPGWAGATQNCSPLTLKLILRKPVTADSMIAFGPFLAFGIALVWLLQQSGLSGPAGF
ncbi:hypothetical protein [Oceanicaulis alexandrii]|uniref:hypothetical protein n=1 Tax=Oceanicaulis alexandrii TaxID=153233 RepID=UPI002355383A|nr:hypothetical protein [Oceanicaulis alexandrii]